MIGKWARRDPKFKVIPTVQRELVSPALIETNDNVLPEGYPPPPLSP